MRRETVRSGARKPDISTVDAVKKMLLDARSITYVDPARGTIGINAWATVQRLGLAEALRDKTTLALGGPRAQELAASGVAEINLGPFSTMRSSQASSALGLASRRIDAVTRRRNDGHPREGSRWSAGTAGFPVVAGSERSLRGAQHGDGSLNDRASLSDVQGTARSSSRLAGATVMVMAPARVS